MTASDLRGGPLPAFAHDCNGDRDGRYCGGAHCATCYPRAVAAPISLVASPVAKPAEAKEKEFLPMGKRHKPGCDVLDPGQDQYECDCPDRTTPPTDEEVMGQGGERHGISLEAAQKAISDECDAMKVFLLDKNKKYGNSAFQPINVMSRLSPLEGIKLRIDDKLKRMQMGDGTATEDTIKDLGGYLLLHGAAKRLGL